MRTPVAAPPTGPGHPTKLIVLSTILYAIFAFVVTIVALNIFWPAGLVLGLVLGWRGGFIPSFGQTTQAKGIVQAVAPETPARHGSGNASFDAYRADMLNRLEQEQKRFDGFLTRLRDAKDKTEFDRFMNDRAARADRTRAVARPMGDPDDHDATPAPHDIADTADIDGRRAANR